MLHDVVQRKKFYTLVLQKCLTRSVLISFFKSEDKVQGDKVVKESISISFINRLGIFIGVVGAIIRYW